MRVTELMIDRAKRAFNDGMADESVIGRRGCIEKALEAALDDIPEVSTITYDPKSPPSAEFPFKLTAQEEGAMDRMVSAMDVSECLRVLREAVRRAVRTLAAPKVEALSEGEELVLAYVEKYDAPKDAHVDELVKAMRIRFPKPEKTPEELCEAITVAFEKGRYVDGRNLLIELTTLAKGKP